MDTTTALPTVGDGTAVDAPTTFRPVDLGDGITVVPSYLPVPGMGVLAANAFVVHGPEPVLVDTGPGGAEGFERALRSVVDPASLRWLWLTHTDPDHVGALAWLLDAAPELTVVTTYLAVGKLGMHLPLPLDRVRWANPGDRVDVAPGRQLVAVRPPTYDAPETVGCYDPSTGTLFTADAFGAVLAEPAATVDDVGPGALADGLALWTTVDTPWIHDVERRRFDQRLAAVAGLGARRLLSAHLPPATGRTTELVDRLARVPGAPPWVGPDQRALDALRAEVSNDVTMA